MGASTEVNHFESNIFLLIMFLGIFLMTVNILTGMALYSLFAYLRYLIAHWFLP
jgi:hypothetical protein